MCHVWRLDVRNQKKNCCKVTTSQSDDSYRDRNWPLPKVTTVTEIVLNHFQKWRQSQRSSPNRSFRARLPSKTNLQSQFLTTVTRGKPGASPGQARGRLHPPFRGAYFRRRSSALFLAKHSNSRAGYLPKSYFKLQKWQQLQRSYFTTSNSDDSYRDRTWPLPKVTTVTEIVLDHFQKWRQLQRSYFSVLQKWRQSQRSSPNRSFRARLPSKTNLQSQFLTTVTRGKPGASPRQARGRLNPPFRGANTGPAFGFGFRLCPVWHCMGKGNGTPEEHLDDDGAQVFFSLRKGAE